MTLKEIRLNKRITQVELAKRVGIRQQTISHYETGRAKPSLDVAVKLAKVLGVSVEEIYEAWRKEIKKKR